MTERQKEIIKNCEKNGVITASDITESGLHRSVLSKLVESGEYYRAERGVYIRTDEWDDEFYLLQHKYRRGIFSHATALYLHGYSDRVPMIFQMTFPKGYNNRSLKNENVSITRVCEENYDIGITELITPFGNTVKVYNLERCLCDILRGKGDDIQIINDAMRKYASSKERDINRLMKYAIQLKVEPKVRRYMEVLL